MFEQSFLANAPAASRFWSTGAGFAGEVAFLAIVAVAPLVVPPAAPKLTSLTHIVFPSPPPPPLAPGPSVQARSRSYPNRQFRGGILVAPVRPPDTALILIDDPADFAPASGGPDGVAGGIEGGIPGGIMDSILSSAHATPPPPAVASGPPPAAPKPAPEPPRVRVGGLVQPAVIVSRVEPVFPPLAVKMRIVGTVELEGVIGIDGRIRELRVLSGHPLLVKAAVDAVRQWVYRPTKLNGDPVEIISPISVNFRLN